LGPGGGEKIGGTGSEVGKRNLYVGRGGGNLGFGAGGGGLKTGQQSGELGGLYHLRSFSPDTGRRSFSVGTNGRIGDRLGAFTILCVGKTRYEKNETDRKKKKTQKRWAWVEFPCPSAAPNWRGEGHDHI